MPPGCVEFDRIQRPLFWQTITIAQIAICDDRVDTGVRNMADPTTPLILSIGQSGGYVNSEAFAAPA
jgi:hypothetical protein